MRRGEGRGGDRERWERRSLLIDHRSSESVT